MNDKDRMLLALEKLHHNKLLRLLAPLIHKGAFLTRCEEYGIGAFRYASTAGGEPMAGSVSPGDVRQLAEQDLIEAFANGYRITAAGRAWLKRELSAGNPFQSQQGVRSARVRELDGNERLVIVNDGESPLAWLASRKDKSGKPLIAPHQYAAGERLRADYSYAAMTGRVTANYSPIAPGGQRGANSAAQLGDSVLAARQRVSQALAAVGPELAGVLVDVCCHLKGLEEAEREEGWPQRSGKVVLQLALTGLARHYGLIGEADARQAASRRIRQWGTEDYRPSAKGGEKPHPATDAC